MYRESFIEEITDNESQIEIKKLIRNEDENSEKSDTEENFNKKVGPNKILSTIFIDDNSFYQPNLHDWVVHNLCSMYSDPNFLFEFVKNLESHKDVCIAEMLIHLCGFHSIIKYDPENISNFYFINKNFDGQVTKKISLSLLFYLIYCLEHKYIILDFFTLIKQCKIQLIIEPNCIVQTRFESKYHNQENHKMTKKCLQDVEVILGLNLIQNLYFHFFEETYPENFNLEIYKKFKKINNNVGCFATNIFLTNIYYLLLLIVLNTNAVMNFVFVCVFIYINICFFGFRVDELIDDNQLQFLKSCGFNRTLQVFLGLFDFSIERIKKYTQ